MPESHNLWALRSGVAFRGSPYNYDVTKQAPWRPPCGVMLVIQNAHNFIKMCLEQLYSQCHHLPPSAYRGILTRETDISSTSSSSSSPPPQYDPAIVEALSPNKPNQNRGLHLLYIIFSFTVRNVDTIYGFLKLVFHKALGETSRWRMASSPFQVSIGPIYMTGGSRGCMGVVTHL